MIEKTGAWSESTAKRLEALLANIEDRSKDFREAGAALLEAKVFMSNLLTQNANALAHMADASRNVQAYTSGLVGQSDALKAIRFTGRAWYAASVSPEPLGRRIEGHERTSLSG